MIISKVETLSTTRSLIVSAAGVDGAVPRTVFLNAGSAADIFIGGAGVTAANGYQIGTGTLTVLLGPGDDLWAIAGSLTPTIRMMVTRADVQT